MLEKKFETLSYFENCVWVFPNDTETYIKDLSNEQLDTIIDSMKGLNNFRGYFYDKNSLESRQTQKITYNAYIVELFITYLFLRKI